MSLDADPRKATERVTATEARPRLTELLNRAAFQGEEFILTKHGDDIAVVLGVERFKHLTAASQVGEAA